MALRMDRSRLRALRALHEAGPAGVGYLSVTDAPNLVAHLLAEEFIDPSRYQDIRYRLTWIGRKYALFLFEGVIDGRYGGPGATVPGR